MNTRDTGAEDLDFHFLLEPDVLRQDAPPNEGRISVHVGYRRVNGKTIGLYIEPAGLCGDAITFTQGPRYLAGVPEQGEITVEFDAAQWTPCPGYPDVQYQVRKYGDIAFEIRFALTASEERIWDLMVKLDSSSVNQQEAAYGEIHQALCKSSVLSMLQVPLPANG